MLCPKVPDIFFIFLCFILLLLTDLFKAIPNKKKRCTFKHLSTGSSPDFLGSVAGTERPAIFRNTNFAKNLE